MKARDLSNPSHENELNENLEAQNVTGDSHENDIVDESSVGNQSTAPEVTGVVADPNPSVEKSSEDAQGKNLVEEHGTDSDLQSEPDYSIMEKKELVDRLSLLVEGASLKGKRGRIEAIKQNFYKKHQEEIAEIRRKFLEDGGAEEDFGIETDALELKMKELLQKVREKKFEMSRNLEMEKEENLKKKYQIIEDIKDLVNRKESFEKTFQEFRDLQKKWHDTGMVPQSALKDLWDNYHHHVENFYDYIKINKDLRDMDLKKNMAAKIRLCENSEKLLDEPSVVKAFNTLQKYHHQWREIGPVPGDVKEELWNRFKEVTTVINRKHQEFYEGLKSDQKGNLEKKTVLCEKAEGIANRKISSHKEWNATSKEILDLQKEWRTIGFAPKKDNNSIYQRFRAACDMYFDRKREYYLKLKDVLVDNLEKKTELCRIAESLQNSTDWKETTDQLIDIQKQWKAIGPVPRKISEDLWARFRAACDKFFSNKSEHFDNADSDQIVNLKRKEELVQRLKDFKMSGDDEVDLAELRQIQQEWAEIGHVPFKKKDKIQEEYRKAVNLLYDKMSLGNDNLEVQKFKTKIDSFLTMSNSEDKIIVERNKIANKIKQLEADIALWENNVGFFSSSKNADAVVKDIELKIEKGKQSLILLQEKLKVIDGLV